MISVRLHGSVSGMKPSREEVEKLAHECFHAYSEWHIDLERFSAAMYEAGAAAERAVSDKLLAALKETIYYRDSSGSRTRCGNLYCSEP